MKKALITGITGQDGSYLSELLLAKGYEVHGIKRRQSTINTERVDDLRSNPEYRDRFKMYYGDMTDSFSLLKLVNQIQPDEVYNLGAQSHVRVSFEVPEYTAEATGGGDDPALGYHTSERHSVQVLPGIYIGALWRLAGDGAPEGGHDLLPEKPLWGGEAL